MTTAVDPVRARREHRPPSAGARAGYTATIIVDAVLLWVVHHLLAWGWPAFLTDDFELVLGVLSASLVASMLVNAVFVLVDRAAVKAAGDLVNAAFAFAVTLRTWQVFPFDFTAYATDWSGLMRVALVVGMVATGIAAIANLVKLLTSAVSTDQDATPLPG